MQAVEDEDAEGAGDEFGGGVLRKRQRAAAHSQPPDGEAADLQQVITPLALLLTRLLLKGLCCP